MFEVPRSAPRSNPWPLAMLWIGVAVLNLVGIRFVVPSLLRAFEVRPGSYSLISIVVYGAIGLLTVVLQWLALRRFFPGLRMWLLAHGTFLILRQVLQFPASQGAATVFNSGGDIPTGLLVIGSVDMVWTLLIGLIGRRLFRPLTRRAWLWPAVLILETLIQTLLLLLVLWPRVDAQGGGADLAFYNTLGAVLTLAMAGAQAAVLALFSRDQHHPDWNY
ncbi:MAG TPA: hypothetical protein VD886_00780 [Herpetosiphonaceae bacterium]|nr:hypothetical protein [Herpetosiphonaceae bacterium]